MSPASWLLLLAGVALILVILWDAFETVLVPRRIGRRIRLTRYFYLVTWRIWRRGAMLSRKPSRRESLLGFYGPLSLIGLLACWAGGLILGFAILGHATENHTGGLLLGFGQRVYLSGETFFTLGFGDITPMTRIGRFLSVLEAGLGFAFLGTVIGYLPTMYASFAGREIEINLMDARAGSPPSAAEFLRRTAPGGALCNELLADWERWAAQLLETHISYPQLAYYRSQHSNQSWLAALITMLDTTSLIIARGERPDHDQAGLTFAMARHALVDITQVFVRRFPAERRERLSAGEREALRSLLLDGVSDPAAARASFDERLDSLRLMYEPYAQALGEYLRFDMPPWAGKEPRHFNWQGGPWDRLIHTQRVPGLPGDDHF